MSDVTYTLEYGQLLDITLRHQGRVARGEACWIAGQPPPPDHDIAELFRTIETLNTARTIAESALVNLADDYRVAIEAYIAAAPDQEGEITARAMEVLGKALEAAKCIGLELTLGDKT